MSDQILILGMSHVTAVQRALEAARDQSIRTVNLDAAPQVYDRDQRRLDLRALRVRRPRAVVLMLGGNLHNRFGMLEHPEPFTLAAADGTLALDPARQVIPREVMRETMATALAPIFEIAVKIHVHYGAAPRWLHVSAPPPIADTVHIRRHPGIFYDKLDLGFPPAQLRHALYQMQTELYAACARRHGATFVLPPARALTPDGFLAQPYWDRDPTHGNAAYGRLVLDDISARLAA